MALAKESRFAIESASTMSNYFGRLRIVGTNAWWTANVSFSDLTGWIGPEPAAFRPDQITLAHGGGLKTGLKLPMGNRGVWVGEGGGQFSGSCKFKGTIAGPGVLSVVSGSPIFYTTELSPGGVRILTNVTVRLAKDVRIGAATGFEVENGGTLYSPDCGLAVRAVLHGGARVKCGVGAGGRYFNDGVLMLLRGSGGMVGTVTLAEGSRLEGVGAENPLRLSVEDRDKQDYVSAAYRGRTPLLRVPVSAGTVTACDFVYETGDSGIVRTIEVETEGGMQTVYAVLSSRLEIESGDDFAAKIAAAAPGTVIVMRPGIYRTAETIAVTNGAIVTSDDGAGRICPELVIFDGGATDEDPTAGHRVFNLSSPGAGLYGLTIRNGFHKSSGGGVWMCWPSTSVSDCIITNCRAIATNGNGGSGGGIYVDAYYTPGYYDVGGPRIVNTTIVSCKAGNGGGASVSSRQISEYTASSDGHTAFVNCSFVDNEAVRNDSNASGGGIGSAITFSHFWVEGCFFSGNWTTMAGTGSASSARMGAAIQTGHYSMVTNCVFDGNGHSYRGMINGGPTRVFDSVFRRGVTRALGDSVELAENCVFTNNLAEFSVTTGSATLRNCLYADNEEPVYTGSSRFENCTIVSNRNCGVFILSGCKPVFVNTVVARNSSPRGISNFRGWNNLGFAVDEWRANVTVSNCCFEGIGEYVNTSNGMNNDVWRIDLLDPTGRSTTADPRLADVERGDYRLSRKSPCRDAGLRLGWMTPEAVDLAGNPRVVTRGKPLAADPGALPDLGCYENIAPNFGFVILIR